MHENLQLFDSHADMNHDRQRSEAMYKEDHMTGNAPPEARRIPRLTPGLRRRTAFLVLGWALGVGLVLGISPPAHAANAAPRASSNSYTTPCNTALTVAASGVLANDTDAEHDPLTAVLVTPPAHGAVTLNADGSFTYTPTAYYRGADKFAYKANDGHADSGIAYAWLTVTNRAPRANSNSYATKKA